ncbi:MAG: DUF4380 domain-containing protein [Terrimicrobiaceae bacterium]|nr:DUF4380 domain-containing protein [Terrimicrobiaceae bacterium]
MRIDTINYKGWPNTLRLSNGTTELVVTTDVGPRILAYQTEGRGNIFHVIEEQCGRTDEPEFQLRGGHRFWLGPEDWILSYHVDNRTVQYRQGREGELVFETLQTDPTPIRKSLGVKLAPEGTSVTIRHTATNEGGSPFRLATWGLSVMRHGGTEIIPQPPLGEHPRDLLPNRNMVLWPYTDLSDPRWTFGQQFWLLRHEAGAPPTKLGLSHAERWVAFLCEDLLYIKGIDFDDSETYPDCGCNFETFTNSEILEIESLGPLKTLAPGESVTHFERWKLFPLNEGRTISSESDLAAWLAPYVKRIG